MVNTKHPTTRYVNAALVVILLFALLGAFLGYRTPKNMMIGYLAAALLPWSLALGCLVFSYIPILTGGKWAFTAWPWLNMNARAMPLVAILFIPLLAGLNWIYPWADSEYLRKFELTENRQWWYQNSFFILRTIFYFTIWTTLAWLPKKSAPLPGNTWAMQIPGGQASAGFGLVLILLSVTAASMDWIMSFDPFFTSTLFGVWVGGGAMLTGLSAAIVGLCFGPNLASSLDTFGKTIGDISSLLLAILMLWAYFSFSQFIIMWSGNLPIEAHYYRIRNVGIWSVITPLTCIVGFAVPFLCLLSYKFKRTPRILGTLATGLIFIRAVELCWIVLPGPDGQATLVRLLCMLITLIPIVLIYFVAAHYYVNRAVIGTDRQLLT